MAEKRLEPRRLLPKEEAVLEANRCLLCEDAPCSLACPAGVDVPGFIERLRTGNLRAAGRVLRHANIFADVCSLVCPVSQLCEGACMATKLSYPILIGCLQHYVAHHTAGRPVPAPTATPGAPSVAVVGAGPAGLVTARELGLRGLRVEVFDAAEEPGGLLLAGIPAYRLPTEVVKHEVGLASTGVSVHTGACLGRDLDLQELRDEFDAVVLAVGLGGTAELAIPGEGLEGVQNALSFIARARRGELTRVPEAAVVVGGGNVATDAAVTAKELGARDVYLLYRRSFLEMPAWPEERNAALEVGVHILVLTVPVAFVDDGQGQVAEVRCAHTTLGEPDASGRRRPEVLEGSLYTIRAQLALLALGQRVAPELRNTLAGVDFDEWGQVVLDDTGMTSLPGVFACGDFANGGATVVQAVGEGKAVADSVVRYLGWGKAGGGTDWPQACP